MKKVYWSLGTFVVLCLTVLALLSYGNPQWSKYVYLWQAYVYPVYYDDEEENKCYIPMPENGQQLSDCKIAQIRKWINDGMPDN